MFEVTNARFEELATEALASLPPSLLSEIENLAIIVDDQAPGRNLYGLYEGVPLTKRGPIQLQRRHARSHHAVPARRSVVTVTTRKT